MRFGHGPTQLVARSSPVVRGQERYYYYHYIQSCRLLSLYRSTLIAFRSFEGLCFLPLRLERKVPLNRRLRPPATSASLGFTSLSTLLDINTSIAQHL